MARAFYDFNGGADEFKEALMFCSGDRYGTVCMSPIQSPPRRYILLVEGNGTERMELVRIGAD